MRVAVIVCAAAVLAAAAPARADHTPAPGTVALVGSLQSELGCPGDWQPECAATRLEPVAGSAGLYRRTFDVPAGTYDYKVALNNTWDENYGAGGAPGGANIPITAPGGPVTFTYDHHTHVISDDAPQAAAGRARRALAAAGTIAWRRRPAADVPAALRARRRARRRGRRDHRRLVGAAGARRRRPAGGRARAVPAPGLVAGAAALLRGAGTRAGAAEGRARGRRVRRGGRAAAEHRRAGPWRARRPLRGRRRAELGPVWSGRKRDRRPRSPSGRRPPRTSRCGSTPRARRRSGGSRCAAATTASGARAAIRRGATRPTATRSASTCRPSTRWSRTS